jgi:hypothetical protein
MNFVLSYLMGGGEITDEELLNLGILTRGKTESGSRKLEIPKASLNGYMRLVKEKMAKGFWNEILSTDDIWFVFKFDDGSIREYLLTEQNEAEIAGLCSEFAKEPLEKTKNVYRYISENDFYRDFMTQNYLEKLNN